MSRQFLKSCLLQPNILIVIHIIDSDDSHVLHIIVKALHQITADKASRTCDQYGFAFKSTQLITVTPILLNYL